MVDVPIIPRDETFTQDALTAGDAVDSAKLQSQIGTIKAAINNLIYALNDFTRDDNTLQDQSLLLRMLSPELLAGIANTSAWKPKENCRLASLSNLPLTGAATVDGVAVVTGDRILVMTQINPVENGVWIANTSGAWSRATDADESTELQFAYTVVLEGLSEANTAWLIALSSVTIGSTDIYWTNVFRPQPYPGNIIGTEATRGVAVCDVNNNALGVQTNIDGVAVSTGMRILLVGQTNTAENGIYRYTGTVLERDDDDDPSMVPFKASGRYVYVVSGSVYAGSFFHYSFGHDDLYTPGLSTGSWFRINNARRIINDLPRVNYLTNGSGIIRRRKEYAATVSGVFNYGRCDRWKGALFGTTVAGTLTFTDSLLFRTPSGVSWQAVTLTGAGKVVFRQYIEAKEAKRIVDIGDGLSFSAWLFQYTGSTKVCTTKLYYANAENDFSAITEISTEDTDCDSGGTIVTMSGGGGYLPSSAKNGLMIEVSLATGAIVAQSIHMTVAVLASGSIAPNSEYHPSRPYSEELAACERYFTSTYPDGTEPTSANAIINPLLIPQLAPASTAYALVHHLRVRPRYMGTYTMEVRSGFNGAIDNVGSFELSLNKAVSAKVADEGQVKITFTTDAASFSYHRASLMYTIDWDF